MMLTGIVIAVLCLAGLSGHKPGSHESSGPEPLPAISPEKAALAEKKAAERAAQKIVDAKQAEVRAKEAAEQKASSDVIYFAKEAVRGMLKDPDSATFADFEAHAVPKGGHIACGRVNAKNGFGGYGGFKRFVSAGTPELTGIEGSMSGFADIWKLAGNRLGLGRCRFRRRRRLV